VPGLRVRRARDPGGRAWDALPTALEDPDPVVIFEHAGLYNHKGELDEDAGPVDLDRARVVREGTDVSLITFGGCLYKTIAAAEELAAAGIAAEVVDLRTLRPLDRATIFGSVRKTHRAVVVDEAWRTGSLAGEISALIHENCLFDLEAPVARVCTEEVPIPYAKHLEEAALPQTPKIVAAAHGVLGR
jgi:pyruvate/2-oxoglutarate/acetoin dehydrogenase E1 component